MLYVKTVNSKVMNATKIISLSSNLRFLTELEMINKPTETRAGAVTHPAVKIEKIGKINDDNKNIPEGQKYWCSSAFNYISKMLIGILILILL